MNFGALPPEVNSGRMYAGPGSGSMLAAAGAWDGLAAELRTAAASYGSVVSGLTSASWLGAASTSMVAAAAPYVAWMSTTAAHAEQAATQAKAAAAAYETAFAVTVPPPVIATNRALLSSLVATNFFGQNSAAIAATEAHYGEMWAQDAAAMYGYAEAAATASTMTPFTVPPQTATPNGMASQAAAVAKAAGTSAQTMTSTGPQLISTVPHALQQLASSSASSSSSTSWVQELLSVSVSQRTSLVRTEQLAYFGLGMPQSFASIAQQLIPGTPGGAGAAGSAPGAAAAALPRFAGLGGGGPVSAGLGQAGTIGGLSVPPSWAAAPAAISSAAAGLPGTGGSAVSAGSPGGVFGGVPLTAAGRRAGGFIHRYGFRHTVMPRPPAAG